MTWGKKKHPHRGFTPFLSPLQATCDRSLRLEYGNRVRSGRNGFNLNNTHVGKVFIIQHHDASIMKTILNAFGFSPHEAS